MRSQHLQSQQGCGLAMPAQHAQHGTAPTGPAAEGPRAQGR